MALRNRKPQRAESALDCIEELREEAEGERRRERELQQERASAITKHGAARETLTAALADGRDGASERTALEEAARVASDHWPERIEAQQRRVRQAEHAIDAFVAESWREVAREKRQRDDAAHARVGQAAEELDAAIHAVNVEDTVPGDRCSERAGSSAARTCSALSGFSRSCAVRVRRASARRRRPRSAAGRPNPLTLRLERRRSGLCWVRHVSADLHSLEALRRALMEHGLTEAAAMVGYRFEAQAVEEREDLDEEAIVDERVRRAGAKSDESARWAA